MLRLERLRSELKWLHTEEWTAASKRLVRILDPDVLSEPGDLPILAPDLLEGRCRFNSLRRNFRAACTSLVLET